jgi:hypothetical protein
MVLSYGSHFFEFIFIFSGSEFFGLSLLGLKFYRNSERVGKKLPYFKKGTLGKCVTLILILFQSLKTLFKIVLYFLKIQLKLL